MQPFVFGDDRFLFGAFHPATGVRKDHAVLLVAPLLNEYMRSYSAMRQIATDLAGQGYDVLRFDFSGTGNSAGTLKTVTAEYWFEDVELAARALLERSNTTRLSSVSVRFGAYLAARLSQSFATTHTVFWDPIFTGDYWHRLLLQAQTSADEKSDDPSKRERYEFLGHVMSAEFVEGLHEARAPVLNCEGCCAILSSCAEIPDFDQIPGSDIVNVEFDCGWENMSSQVLYPHEIIAIVGEQFP